MSTHVRKTKAALDHPKFKSAQEFKALSDEDKEKVWKSLIAWAMSIERTQGRAAMRLF